MRPQTASSLPLCQSLLSFLGYRARLVWDVSPARKARPASTPKSKARSAPASKARPDLVSIHQGLSRVTIVGQVETFVRLHRNKRFRQALILESYHKVRTFEFSAFRRARLVRHAGEQGSYGGRNAEARPLS
eukprot:4410598-Pleurochrysis_carterae.AAC.1